MQPHLHTLGTARSRTRLSGTLLLALAAVPLPAQQRPGFAGDKSCISCHARESETYLHTSHRHTSSLASEETVLGALTPGHNELIIVPASPDADRPALSFRMEAHDGRLTQSALTGFPPAFDQRTEPIDIATGSGKRGQTYLHWEGDRLFELPVSFWTAGSRWVNSPGYIDGTADFSRPIRPGCLECHASYIEPLSPDPATNRFNRTSFAPGIGCETCHGPGAQHVLAHTQRTHPTEGHGPEGPSTDEHIVNPARLSRALQVELCAYCHNGTAREPLAPAFSYRPGKPLADYFKLIETTDAEHPDVHGHQVALLERSRCFQASPTMTCSTCHNTHEPERNAAAYSQKCLGCHTLQACKRAAAIGPTARTACIGCHMPVESTGAIVSETAGEQLHATMRNHWIKIYPARNTHENAFAESETQ